MTVMVKMGEFPTTEERVLARWQGHGQRAGRRLGREPDARVGSGNETLAREPRAWSSPISIHRAMRRTAAGLRTGDVIQQGKPAIRERTFKTSTTRDGIIVQEGSLATTLLLVNRGRQYTIRRGLISDMECSRIRWSNCGVEHKRANRLPMKGRPAVRVSSFCRQRSCRDESSTCETRLMYFEVRMLRSRLVR